MTGADLVKVLEEDFSVAIGAATKSQWKKKKAITATILRNAFSKVENHSLVHAIQPIAEFHLFNFEHGKNVDSFKNRIDDKKIYDDLNDHTGGIYAFYDSMGKLLYVGKTSGKIFTEMNQRYYGKKISYRVIKNKKACWQKTNLSEVSYYFSAYSISASLVTNVEALITRMIVNNASNIKTESFKTSVAQ